MAEFWEGAGVGFLVVMGLTLGWEWWQIVLLVLGIGFLRFSQGR